MQTFSGRNKVFWVSYVLCSSVVKQRLIGKNFNLKNIPRPKPKQILANELSVIGNKILKATAAPFCSLAAISPLFL